MILLNRVILASYPPRRRALAKYNYSEIRLRLFRVEPVT